MREKSTALHWQGLGTVNVTISKDDSDRTTWIPEKGYKMYIQHLDNEDDKDIDSYFRDFVVHWNLFGVPGVYMICPIPAALYDDIKKDEDNERLTMLRDYGKCLVPGKNGSMLLCRKTSCKGCECSYDENRFTRLSSLDARTDDGSEVDLPADGGLSAEDIAVSDHNVEEFFKMLQRKDVLLFGVAIKLFDCAGCNDGHDKEVGETKVTRIAQELGCSKPCVYKKIDQLKILAAPFLKN